MSEIVHSTKPKSYKQKMRERQRKKKKQASIKSKEIPKIPSPIPEKPKKQPKNKISSEYLIEENEIQGVLKELDAKEEQEQNEIDREIQFFTEGVPEIFYDAEDHEPIQADEEPSISNIPDSPVHLASSFVTDDATLIEPYSSKYIKYNDDELLYIPSSKLSEEKRSGKIFEL
jgi:hypothetical protein